MTTSDRSTPVAGAPRLVRALDGSWVSPEGSDEAAVLTNPVPPFQIQMPSLTDERVKLDGPSRARRSWPAALHRFLFISSLVLLLGPVAWVLLDSFLPVSVTPLMGLRAVESLMSGESPYFEKEWRPLERISPQLQAAVLAGEDTRFLEHNGFDFEAIQRALRHNDLVRSGSRRASQTHLQGGSTISQQTAKNVFLWPARSWVRKGIEAYFTELIELIWTKQRILEVYLNVVEWGDGIYGAEAAAQTYFHKPASQLTAREAALLASVLPNPRLFSVGHPSGFVRLRQATIQARMPATMQFLIDAQARHETPKSRRVQKLARGLLGT